MNNNPCDQCIVQPMCEKGCEKLAEYLKDVVIRGNYWKGNRSAIYMADQIKNGRFELVGRIVRRKSDKAIISPMFSKPNEISTEV